MLKKSIENLSPIKAAKSDVKKADENITPGRSSNNMMMSWLMNKKTNKAEEEGSKTSAIKKIDYNSQSSKTEKTTPKKETKSSASSKLAKTKSVESDEEEFTLKKKTEKKTETKIKEEPKTSTKALKKPTSPKDEVKKSSSKKDSPKLDDSSSKPKKGANKFYAAYMRREGPKNPGSKKIPIGKKDCFHGLKFLITGVLDSLDRDECKGIVEKYGGSLVSGVTKKLDYLIVGEDAGESKLQKARELNVKQVNEDEFLSLICEKSGIKNPSYEVEMKEELSESVNLDDVEEAEEVIKPKPEKKTPVKVKIEPATVKTESVQVEKVKVEPSLLWVDKYKPTSMSKIIGQGSDKSNASKLLNWLRNWDKLHGSGGADSKAKKWNDQDTGSCYKAALLSGPPGIGKTTTAQLTTKEAGYTFIEFNASDARSKKLLNVVLGQSVDNCSMDSYIKSNHSVHDKSQDKHCIIMDEVDGMAGNEDRGGVLELINAIKQTKIPIICICNDRQHVKIRSLANHCFDLRFYKPRIEQVRASLMSICFKENIKISADLIDQIITGCNYDIRQCLHNLSMWSSNKKNFTQVKTDIEKAMKDTRMNPFEACKQVFHPPDTIKSMQDKMDLFFTDYSLMPLLVAENYLSVKPFEINGKTKGEKELKHLRLLSESVESICQADRVGKILRTENNWSLLTSQSIFATVIPGEKLKGSIGLPAFPAWFGKNSKQGRVDRILQELQKHMRLNISANKLGVGMDYLSILKNRLSAPLIKKGADGIEQVIAIMNEYNLTREDFDTILELSTWPGQKDPMSLIESKVKASFTRAFNKESHRNPFSVVSVKKLKAAKEENGEEGEEEEVEEKDDDVTADAMIKVNTKPKKTASSAKTSGGGVKRGANSKDADTEASKPKAKKKKT